MCFTPDTVVQGYPNVNQGRFGWPSQSFERDLTAKF